MEIFTYGKNIEWNKFSLRDVKTILASSWYSENYKISPLKHIHNASESIPVIMLKLFVRAWLSFFIETLISL